MKCKILYTKGKGKFSQKSWEKPEITDNEIEVKAVMTGVCRSDIDMMEGNFGPLPLEMQGHEGLGIVTKVGRNIENVKVGDYVATRGEPAYSDYYNTRYNEYVTVPELDPKYILEPVACGVNLVVQAEDEFRKREGEGKRLAILGSGFLAQVAYTYLKAENYKFSIDVIGNHNKDVWKDLRSEPSGTYDVVIDLSGRNTIFEDVIYNEDALIIFGAQKEVTTDFSGMLWKAVTMVFPSPRNPKFYRCMVIARNLVKLNELNLDKFWTKSYNRKTEWKQAFEDGLNRPEGYSRGYIKWD